ncbi:MAG: hypothetical protein AAGG50_15205 [Bacteroidota bacterium]
MLWSASWVVARALGWSDLWYFAEIGATASIPSALLLGALAAPRVVSDALATGSTKRGWVAGLVTTGKIYELSALLVAVAFAFAGVGDFVTDIQTDPLGSLAQAPSFLLSLLLFFLFATLFGIPFLLPSLALGAAAGWLCYLYALRTRL